MADTRQTVVSWLRDAHAMEEAAVDNLQKHIETFKAFPRVEQKLREDLERSRRQSQELEQFLERMGADRSALKDMGMKFAAAMQPYLGSLSEDDVVKHLLAAHAYKNFEVASYRSLATAAEQIGDAQIKEMCERSLREKKELADWIEEELPTVTREHLSRAGH